MPKAQHIYRLVLAASALSFGACDSGETTRGPQPVLSFAFDDDASPGLTNLGGELFMRSCVFGVRDEHKDQYIVDGQADTNPSPTTIVVYFTETRLTKPAQGDLTLPANVAVKITLPSPYGVMNGTGGTVKVSEVDGWRIVEVKDVLISGTRDSGKLNATLACGL